jgi:hypothetical protein
VDTPLQTRNIAIKQNAKNDHDKIVSIEETSIEEHSRRATAGDRTNMELYENTNITSSQQSVHNQKCVHFMSPSVDNHIEHQESTAILPQSTVLRKTSAGAICEILEILLLFNY